MSEKLSERAARIGGFWMVEFAPEIAALERQLAAKDAEIARLRSAMVECGIPLEVIAGELNVGNMLEISTEVAQQIHRAVGMVRAALAETPAAPQYHCSWHAIGWHHPDCPATPGSRTAKSIEDVRRDAVRSMNAPEVK